MIKNKHIVIAQSSLLAIVGLGLVVQRVFGFINQHLNPAHVVVVNPFGVSPSLALTIIGILLLFLVPYLYKQREIAYALSIVLALSAFFITITYRHMPIAMLVLIAGFVGWMILSRRLYTVKSDLVSLMFGVRIALLVSLIGYVYGLVGLLLLGPTVFHQHFSLYEAAILSFKTLFTLQNIDAPTNQAEVFIHSLDVIGGLVFTLVIMSLFKPVRFVLGIHRDDKLLASEILQQTSQSSEDYFKLWPNDKHYFFSATRRSFLAYKTSGRTAIILGDPSGDPDESQQLVANFHTFVASNGWLVAAINATSISRTIYKHEGLNEIFIGNEAIITIDDFIKHTLRSKHFRYVYNKAQRDGLTVEHWQRLNDEQISILKLVSDSWLLRGGRKEYTFFMGYFDAAYLRAGSVMVLKQNDQVIAYISILPSFVEKEASIDHLRSVSEVSPVAMHFLLAQLIATLHDEGKQSLNIGFAPLSGIELQDSQPVLTGKLLGIIKKFGNRYYSFKGIEQFKGKSDPVWHPRYLYYTGGVTALTVVARDIERAGRRFDEQAKRGRIIGAMVIFALIIIIIQFM